MPRTVALDPAGIAETWATLTVPAASSLVGSGALPGPEEAAGTPAPGLAVGAGGPAGGDSGATAAAVADAGGGALAFVDPWQAQTATTDPTPTAHARTRLV